MQLDADHSGVARFGSTQEDKDNLKVVQSNVKELYEVAIKKCELVAIPSMIGHEGKVFTEEDVLRMQFGKLEGK